MAAADAAWDLLLFVTAVVVAIIISTAAGPALPA